MRKANNMQKINRQAKVVPELIYNMEQLDVQLISLSRCVRDKLSVTRLIKPSTARDFRINTKGDDDIPLRGNGG